MQGALAGLRVLDFSTLVPGPLATLMLAQAGAEVIKVERPDTGDPLRRYDPLIGGENALFQLLNQGKRSIAADLKDIAKRDKLLHLACSVDVVVEQFRPGVMDRLGLGYEAIRTVNPRVIYCSITGFGQTGPKRDHAGHDLTFLAEAGLMSDVPDYSDGQPLPLPLLADFAGGTYPALISILMALWQRERSGKGAHLDIGITPNLLTLSAWDMAVGYATGKWQRSGLMAGSSPRYRLYRAADGQTIVVAALESVFWQRFCAAIGLVGPLSDDESGSAAVIQAIQDRLGAHPAAHWRQVFDRVDCCCSIAERLPEALKRAQPLGAVQFDNRVVESGNHRSSLVLPPLPLPVSPALLCPGSGDQPAPRLGADTEAYLAAANERVTN